MSFEPLIVLIAERPPLILGELTFLFSPTLDAGFSGSCLLESRMLTRDQAAPDAICVGDGRIPVLPELLPGIEGLDAVGRVLPVLGIQEKGLVNQVLGLLVEEVLDAPRVLLDPVDDYVGREFVEAIGNWSRQSWGWGDSPTDVLRDGDTLGEGSGSDLLLQHRAAVDGHPLHGVTSR